MVNWFTSHYVELFVQLQQASSQFSVFSSVLQQHPNQREHHTWKVSAAWTWDLTTFEMQTGFQTTAVSNHFQSNRATFCCCYYIVATNTMLISYIFYTKLFEPRLKRQWTLERLNYEACRASKSWGLKYKFTGFGTRRLQKILKQDKNQTGTHCCELVFECHIT